MKHYVLLLCVVVALRESGALSKGSTDYEGFYYNLLYITN